MIVMVYPSLQLRMNSTWNCNFLGINEPPILIVEVIVPHGFGHVLSPFAFIISPTTLDPMGSGPIPPSHNFSWCGWV